MKKNRNPVRHSQMPFRHFVLFPETNKGNSAPDRNLNGTELFLFRQYYSHFFSVITQSYP